MDTDTYTLTVTFTRQLSEDLPVVEARLPGLSLKEALIRQLRDELQDACDEGMAGEFNVDSLVLPDGVNGDELVVKN
jgi:hypothetical protein